MYPAMAARRLGALPGIVDSSTTRIAPRQVLRASISTTGQAMSTSHRASM